MVQLSQVSEVVAQPEGRVDGAGLADAEGVAEVALHDLFGVGLSGLDVVRVQVDVGVWAVGADEVESFAWTAADHA